MTRRGTVMLNRTFAAWERYRAGKVVLRKVHAEGDFKKQMDIIGYNPIRYISHSCEEALDNLLGFFILAAMRKHKFVQPILNKYISSESLYEYRYLSVEKWRELIEESQERDIIIRYMYPKDVRRIPVPIIKPKSKLGVEGTGSPSYLRS